MMALILASAAAACLFELFQPFWLKLMIDQSILGGAVEKIPGFVFLFFLFLLSAQGLRFLETVFSDRLSARIAGDLRLRLWKRMLGVRLEKFQSRLSGQWISALSDDISLIQNYWVDALSSFAGHGLFLLGMIVFILFWNPLMLIAFGAAPVFFLAAFFFRNRYLESSEKVLESQEKLYGFFDEVFQAGGDIRQFRMGPALAKEARRYSESHRELLLKQARLGILFPVITESLGWLLMAVILGLGGLEVLRGDMSFGTLVAFLEFSRRFFSPLREMTDRWHRFQAARAAFRRLRDAETWLEPERVSGLHFEGLTRAIRFDRVDFDYDSGQVPVFDRLSFEIERGEKVAIVGPSGSGKSTLLKLLLGLYEPAGGEILLDGVPLSEWNLRSIRAERRSPLLLDEIEKEMDENSLQNFLSEVLTDPHLTVIWVTHQEKIFRAFPRVIDLNRKPVLADSIQT